MSFQIQIGVIGGNEDDVVALANSVGRTLPLHVSYDKAIRMSGNAVLTVGEQENQDGSSLLSDSADWNADVWLLRDDALAKLEETVLALFDVSPRGILFRASWIGEKATREIAMHVHELRATILSNRVPSKMTVVLRKERV